MDMEELSPYVYKYKIYTHGGYMMITFFWQTPWVCGGVE